MTVVVLLRTLVGKIFFIECIENYFICYNSVRYIELQDGCMLNFLSCLVHIHVLIPQYPINTNECIHILLSHQFINAVHNSKMFQHLMGHLQGV